MHTLAETPSYVIQELERDNSVHLIRKRDKAKTVFTDFLADTIRRDIHEVCADEIDEIDHMCSFYDDILEPQN